MIDMEDTKNDSMQDTEAPASKEAHSPPNKTRSIIANLDATIASFGDGHIARTCSFPSTENDEQTSLDGDAGILKKFAPPGLEDPFQQLHSILFPALYRASKCNAGPSGTPSTPGSSSSSLSFRNPVSSSSAAILMGVRGSGKTLLLERVLEACQEQLQGSSNNDDGRRPCILYRMVEINGIVCRGEDVASVVYEIIRQLSGIAYRSMQITKCEESPVKSKRNRTRETTSAVDSPKKITQPSGSMGAKTDGFDDDHDDDDDERTTGKRKQTSTRGDDNAFADSDHRSAIVRETTDETTTKAGERQRRRQRRKQRKIDKRMLRLRRATFNSNLALLESTLELAAADDIPILLNLDELDSFTSDEGERQMLLYHFLDRVATPGSNLILVGMTSSFSALTLLEKRIRSRAEGTAKIIYLRTPQSYPDLLELLENKLNGCVVARDILDRLAHPKDAESNASKIVSEHGSDRNERIDAIVKLSVAMEREFRLGRDIRWFSRVISTALSLYRHDCILAAAARNGGIDTADSVRPEFDTKHLWDAMAMMGASISEATVASRQPDLCLVDDTAVTPRLQALLDLSTPQVALLLSARRILKREEHRDQAVLAPLTMERMLKEYESFRRGSNSTGNSKLLKRAAFQLMQQGLLVPSIDHSGGGALQYFVSKVYRTLDPYALSRLPLHIPFDIDRELGKALEQNLLECPTSLKEWGK
mmetsp:Transcript_5490/g.13556  ORF Transcript_5490/g.13556 Transcript_5490/m.13556 type:complete len:706 (-) Transcript_5490:96-2213(-)